jgi:hypothetical protein
MRYLLITCVLLAGCSNINFGEVNPEDITNMYSTYIEEWKNECSTSFNEAEKEIFKEDDKPIIIDDTNPDPAKCICKGTGVIIHGDGHKTVCPYHGKSSSTQLKR